MNIKLKLVLAALMVISPFGLAFAHHANTTYDHGNLITVGGTVQDFHWSNPHTWIDVMVPLGNGEEQLWKLEGTNVNTLIRAGWTKETLQPGMQVKILVSPRKDGEPVGEWNKVISINGVPFNPPVTEQ